MDVRPVGKRFSHVYLERGSPTPDSKRFRRRLLATFRKIENTRVAFSDLIESELGVELHYVGYDVDWEQFFLSEEIKDVLDAVTLIFANLQKSVSSYQAEAWRNAASRIISEENLGYRVDELGGVHLGVDEEFEHNRTATLASLGSPRYRSAQDSFERALKALDEHPADTRSAIQRTFEACETIFRLIFGKQVSRLGSTEIDARLKPAIKGIFEGSSLNAANMMCSSFADWVNGAHQYRHAKGVEAPEPPPVGLAVLMVSLGASYLRWLIELDEALQP